jgi:signal transduction histidine kinase
MSPHSRTPVKAAPLGALADPRPLAAPVLGAAQFEARVPDLADPARTDSDSDGASPGPTGSATARGTPEPREASVGAAHRDAAYDRRRRAGSDRAEPAGRPAGASDAGGGQGDPHDAVAAGVGYVTPVDGWPAVSAALVMAPISERADRWIAVLVGLHAMLALALGPVHDTVPETLVLTAVGAGAYYASWLLRPGSFLTRAMAGVVLQLFCALHIHQMSGLAEMHFFYFISVTAMILYQDWRAMWPGIAAIIAQHTLFSVWHNAGVHPGDMRFFEPDHIGVGKLAWHYGLALAQSAVASYASVSLRQRTLREAAQRAALATQAQALGEANAELAARAEAVATANQRLQEQATELEAQWAQLQDQATELEAHNEALQAAAAALATHAEERERLLTEATRRRQEAEQARGEAEEANVVKAQFLASMSHELRTPLNAIGGYAELLAMGIRGAVTPEQHDDLGRIKRASQHLLALINDILQYARLEAGQLGMELRPVPLDATLGELDALIAPQLAAKRLAYRYVPCDAALAVHADRERLVQVLLNVLTNAVKYTPAGGRVDLWCESAPGGGVAVRVRDTGIGIPTALQRKIFDPFFQASRTFSTPEGGVGLGLAISRDLARAMGGDLTVESVPGVGSTFTLTLCAEPSATGANAALATAPATAPATVR